MIGRNEAGWAEERKAKQSEQEMGNLQRWLGKEDFEAWLQPVDREDEFQFLCQR